MKTKMMSVTLAAILGIAGVTSALAQGYNSDTNEWTQALIANSTSTGKHKGYSGADSGFAQGYNSDTNEWTQALIANSTSTGKHKGYGGADSTSTGIGQNLDSYGKTVRMKHNHAAERGGYASSPVAPK